MFRKNTRHLQILLTSHGDELPEELRNRLRNPWAETFSQKFSCRLDEEPFSFRERLSRPMQETGENLLEQSFAQVTDEQQQVFGLKTDKQRLDSMQLAANIRQMGRMRLLQLEKDKPPQAVWFVWLLPVNPPKHIAITA